MTLTTMKYLPPAERDRHGAWMKDYRL